MLAIAAATAFLAVFGYINSKDTELLEFASDTIGKVVFGGVAIAAIIHLPRLRKR